MKHLRTFTLMALPWLISGCTGPTEFQAAGMHSGQKYKIEVVKGKETFNPSLSVRLNGKEALFVKRVNMFKDPNCQKTKVASWRCRYTTDYDGKQLVVVEETNATLASNSLNYDIYLDGDYVQRVVAAMY